MPPLSTGSLDALRIIVSASVSHYYVGLTQPPSRRKSAGIQFMKILMNYFADSYFVRTKEVPITASQNTDLGKQT